MKSWNVTEDLHVMRVPTLENQMLPSEQTSLKWWDKENFAQQDDDCKK